MVASHDLAHAKEVNDFASAGSLRHFNLHGVRTEHASVSRASGTKHRGQAFGRTKS